MVHSLGLKSYGVYTLAFTIACSGYFLDLGLGWTTSKFMAEADAQADQVLLSATMKATLVYQVAIGLVFLAVIFPLAAWIARSVLNFSGDDIQQTTVLVRIAAVAFSLSNISNTLVSALRGTRQFASATVVSAAGATVSIGGAALAAWFGMGILAAATAQLSGVVAGLSLGIWVCKGYFSPHVGLGAIRRRFRAMLGFSFWSYLNRITQILVLQADKVLVGRFGGAVFLPYYTVPFNVAHRLNFLAGPAVTAIFPAAAAGQLDRESFMKQYFSGARLVHVMTGAAALAVLYWGGRFMTAWVGEDMARNGFFYLRVFTVGYWLLSVGSFDAACAEGWNRPRTMLAVVFGGTLAGIFIVILAWSALGPMRAIASAVGTWLSFLGIGSMVVWQRIARYPMKYYFRRIIFPVGEMSLLGLGLTIIFGKIQGTRLLDIAILALLAILLAGYGFLRSFPRDERQAIISRLFSPIYKIEGFPAWVDNIKKALL